MDKNIFLNYDGGMIQLKATVIPTPFNYSDIYGFREGSKYVGWAPNPSNGTFKTDIPRYFTSSGYASDSYRFPNEFTSEVTNFDGDNVLVLDKSLNCVGEPGIGNTYTGVTVSNAESKELGNFFWGYKEIDDPEHPGQKIPITAYIGLNSLIYPDASLTGVAYAPVKTVQSAYNETNPTKMAFWIITIHDDVVGSVTENQDFEVLVQVRAVYGVGAYRYFYAFSDMRLLEGVNKNPPSKSTAKGNTPNGFRGGRDDHSDSDTESHIGLGFREMFSGGEHGVRVKQLGHDQVQVFYNCLWQQDLWENFQQWKWNPIGCVLSLHLMPCDPEYVATQDSNNKLGGYELKYEDSGLTVYSQGKSCANYREIKTKIFHPEEYTHSFLDWGKNTSISFRLPFIGTVPIDTSKVMNGGIFAKYNIDFYTGNCLVQIYTIPAKDVMGAEGDWDEDYGGCLCMIAQYAGNCAHKIAVSGNDYGAGQVVGAIVSGISSVASLATDVAGGHIIGGRMGKRISAYGVLGGVSGITNAVGSAFMARHNISVIPATPNADTLGIMIPALIIERPIDITPLDENGVASVYEGFNGRPAASGGSVKDYKALDEGDGLFIQGILHADTIYATEDEKRQIESAFAKGVYL